jgi:4-hydroxy-3-polyprenylbenzoate decarboxylase
MAVAITERIPQVQSGAPRPWRDAREWIDRVRAVGELRDVRGIDWQAGIGEITEMLDHSEGSPCVLFDEVPGYPAGRRVMVNCNGTPQRQAVTLNLPPSEANHEGLFRFWRTVLHDFAPIDPVVVASGPVFENSLRGSDVDLEAFPTPIWHPQDGGRFIGTASMNILKDPDSDWVNIGTYRNQIFARDEMGIYISPGKHGRLIRDAYLKKGERIPVAVVVGADPLLFMSACAEGIPYGMSEYAWAGGVRGEAVEVVLGPVTGLPIPATAEIAIEGWIDPAAPLHDEGPYGEWMGYYASGEGRTHVIKVEAIHHRDDPILLGCPQGKPPHEDNRFLAYVKSALIENQLRAAGVPRITGVWCPPEAGNRMMTVIAVDQSYPGHATQALMVGSQTGTSAYGGRVAVVVDPDIDITNLDDVLWAIMTRCDPVRDVTIIDRAWSGPLDPAIHPDERGFNSRLLIDATKPWEWRERFAEPVVTGEMSRAARERWGWILDPAARDPRV